jgi:hypothetical protein
LVTNPIFSLQSVAGQPAESWSKIETEDKMKTLFQQFGSRCCKVTGDVGLNSLFDTQYTQLSETCGSVKPPMKPPMRRTFAAAHESNCKIRRTVSQALVQEIQGLMSKQMLVVSRYKRIPTAYHEHCKRLCSLMRKLQSMQSDKKLTRPALYLFFACRPSIPS